MTYTILIADDSRTVREIYRQKLTDQGFRVHLAASAREAMELLAGVTPDLILLDPQMPGGDGLEFLQAIRGLSRFQRVPVLILSGVSDRAQVQRAFDLGAMDYILKSTTPPDNAIRQIREALRPKAA